MILDVSLVESNPDDLKKSSMTLSIHKTLSLVFRESFIVMISSPTTEYYHPSEIYLLIFRIYLYKNKPANQK